MNRRRLLQSMAASAAVGCTGTSTGDCPATDEQIEGPYYFDAEATRIDITEGKSGIPLTLYLQVVDADDCTVIVDAEVDVWQADADGIYSGYEVMSTEGETFLRGIQLTDSNGECQIDTIFPGFYEGRTSHIHIKVRATGYAELTTQLYFPKAAITAVAPEYPAVDEYTTNKEDGFYDVDNEMEVSGDTTSGYAATHAIAIRLE